MLHILEANMNDPIASNRDLCFLALLHTYL